MKSNQLATLVVRLLGIYSLLEAVPMLGMFAGMVAYARRAQSGPAGMADVLGGALLPGIGLLVSGILLIAFSVPLGEKLAPGEGGAAILTPVSFDQVQALAFAVAGVLIFAAALPRLANSLCYLAEWIFQRKDAGYSPYRFTFSETMAAVGTLLNVVLGLALFFRARGIANFWRLLRTAGTPKPPPPSPEA